MKFMYSKSYIDCHIKVKISTIEANHTNSHNSQKFVWFNYGRPQGLKLHFL